MNCVLGKGQTLSVVKKEVLGIQEVFFLDEEITKNEHSGAIIDPDKNEFGAVDQNRSMFPVIEHDTEIDMVNEVIGDEEGMSVMEPHPEMREEVQGNEEEESGMESEAVPIEIKKFQATPVRGRKSQISYRVVDESHFSMIKDQENGKKKIITKDDPRTHTHYVKFLKKEGKTHKVWECGICSKEFRHQYTLMRHLPTHTDERNYKCETCGKGFRQMSTLSQHRAIHSDARPYVCELCKKTFNRVSTLISHRKTHSDNKPHKCEVCGKGFHQKGNLRNHKFTHTNERPYKCESCGKGFNQMSNLMCHKLKAHSHGSKRYICNLCNLEFPRRHALKTHEEYKHGFKSRGGQREQELYSAMYQDISHKHNLKNNIHENFVQNHKMMINDYNQQDGEQNNTSLGVVIEPITTKAMNMAKESGQTPFALLKLVKGNPVLVKVMTTVNGKHILLPATAEDLKSANMITVFPNVDNSRNGSSIKALQIKVPIVATVIQKVDPDGNYTISVESPCNSHELDSLCDENNPPNINHLSSTDVSSSVGFKGPTHSQYVFKNRNMINKGEEKTEADALLERAVSMIQKDQTMQSSIYQEESGLMELVSNDDEIQFVCTSADGTYKLLTQEEAATLMQQPGQTIEVISEDNNHSEENGRGSFIHKTQLNQIVQAMCSAGFQVTTNQEELVLTETEEEVVLGEFDLSLPSQAVYSQPEEILP